MANFDNDNPGAIEWIRSNPRLMAFVGGGAALVLILAGIGFWWFFGGDEQEAQQTAQIDQQTISQTVDECEDATNPEACRERRLSELARRSNALEPCLDLSGTERTDCIWRVARENLNDTHCERIDDQELKMQCRDEVFLLQAVEEQDPSLCEEVTNQQRRTSCVARSSGPTTSENCSERGFDEAYCDDVELKEEAEQTRDFSVCNQIEDKEVREGCVQMLAREDFDGDGLLGAQEREFGSSDASKDTDGDGLLDRIEINVYETDPADPDTDGDGFNDGDEVDAGYDPAGPGQL